MPYTQDYSDYFTITGLPETITRSISQSLSVSESLGVSVSTWKTVISVAVSLSLADSGLSKTVTDFRSNYTNSDSLTLTDSGLSRSTDTWRHIFSVSAGLGLTDSGLTKTTSTWRYVITPSDSLGLTDSGLSKAIDTWRHTPTTSDSLGLTDSGLSKAIETWLHIINYNMSLTVSESLSKATQVWRAVRTNSDSVSVSEGLDVGVETIIHIFSPSDSVTVSESLSKAVQAWFYTTTPSDSLAVSDSLSVQIGVDNDTYFYDTGGLSSKSRLTGSISSGSFTSDTTRVSNSDNLVDSNTNSPCTFSGSNSEACIVFDMTAQTEVNYMALYGSGGSIYFYGSNSQGSGYSLISTASIGVSGWNINRFFTANYRYYAIQMEGLSSDATLSEVLIGKTFSPEIRYDLGSSSSVQSLLESNESYNGTEYVNQIGDAVNLYERQYGNISPTLKTDFENLWIKSNDRKFLYYFDGINYVSVSPISMNEIAHNRYSTSVSLRT